MAIVKPKRAPYSIVVKQTPMKRQIELLRETNHALNELVNELMADKAIIKRETDSLNFSVRNLEHQAIGYRAVISYLESKSENNPV